MPETATTITVDRQVIVDALVDLAQYEEMLSMLNGHQGTALTAMISEAFCNLYRGAFGDPDLTGALYAEIDERGMKQAREWFDAS